MQAWTRWIWHTIKSRLFQVDLVRDGIISSILTFRITSSVIGRLMLVCHFVRSFDWFLIFSNRPELDQLPFIILVWKSIILASNSFTSFDLRSFHGMYDNIKCRIRNQNSFISNPPAVALWTRICGQFVWCKSRIFGPFGSKLQFYRNHSFWIWTNVE